MTHFLALSSIVYTITNARLCKFLQLHEIRKLDNISFEFILYQENGKTCII